MGSIPSLGRCLNPGGHGTPPRAGFRHRTPTSDPEGAVGSEQLTGNTTGLSEDASHNEKALGERCVASKLPNSTPSAKRGCTPGAGRGQRRRQGEAAPTKLACLSVLCICKKHTHTHTPPSRPRYRGGRVTWGFSFQSRMVLSRLPGERRLPNTHVKGWRSACGLQRS